MKEIQRFQVGRAPGQTLMTLAVHPMRNHVAAAIAGGPLMVIDLSNGKRLWDRDCTAIGMEHPSPGMFALSYSFDGNQIVAASDADETIYFIDSESGALTHTAKIPGSGPVGSDFHAVRLDHSGKWVLVNSCFATACLSGQDASDQWFDSIAGHDCCSASLFITRDNHAIYPTADGSIVIRNVESGEYIKRFDGSDSFVVSENELELLYYRELFGFVLLSLSTGTEIRSIEFTSRLISRTFAWSSNQALLAVVDDSNDAELILALDTSTGEVIDRFQLPPNASCWQIALNPHVPGSIVIGSDDGSIRTLALA